MLRALETSFIYFPTRADRDAQVIGLESAANVEEVWLRGEDSVQVHGVFAQASEPLAHVLFFHGNAGNLFDRLYNVEALVQSGLSVLIIDYRGYGKSDGSPSEAGLYRDADAAYRHLTQDRGVAPESVVIFGRSLGAAVAIDLAERVRACCLIAESAFTSVGDMAAMHYSWVPGFLRRSLSHDFDSLRKVASLELPVLFVHGDRDTIVPIEMGRKLFETASEPKDWLEIRGAGHNDMIDRGGASYFRRLREFVSGARGGDQSAP